MAKGAGLSVGKGHQLLVFIIAASIGMAFISAMLIPQLVSFTTALGDVTDAPTAAMLGIIGIAIGAGVIFVILKAAGLF